MSDHLFALALVFNAALVLYPALTIAQRACLRRSRWHRRYADWYAATANDCRRLATQNASRAERAAGTRAQAFYRKMSERLPGDALRHEDTSRAHSLRARFWDFLA